MFGNQGRCFTTSLSRGNCEERTCIKWLEPRHPFASCLSPILTRSLVPFLQSSKSSHSVSLLLSLHNGKDSFLSQQEYAHLQTWWLFSTLWAFNFIFVVVSGRRLGQFYCIFQFCVFNTALCYLCCQAVRSLRKEVPIQLASSAWLPVSPNKVTKCYK